MFFHPAARIPQCCLLLAWIQGGCVGNPAFWSVATGKIIQAEGLLRTGLKLSAFGWVLWPFSPERLEHVLRNGIDSRWVPCIAPWESVGSCSPCVKSCSYLDVTKTHLLPCPFSSQSHIWSSKTTQAKLSSTTSGFHSMKQQRGIWWRIKDH